MDISELTGLGLHKLYEFFRRKDLVDYCMKRIHKSTTFSLDNLYKGESKVITNKVSGYIAPTITLPIHRLHYLFDEINHIESMDKFEKYSSK